MIALDESRCTRCGVCIKRFENYCITANEGRPVFDHSVCNLCQKCISICPHQAITFNGTHPRKIEAPARVSQADLEDLLSRRRSIKIFRDENISRDILKKIIGAAKYSPNQNKNIDLVVIDDKNLIELLNINAMKSARNIYRLLYTLNPLSPLLLLISSQYKIIKRKMEYDLVRNRSIVKKGTQAIVILSGDKKVPVTDRSAPYLMASMIMTAESLGIGTCLMDSLKITIGGRIKKRLGIAKSILAVLSLGYSAENIVNVPQGYEVKIQWNAEFNKL